MRPHKILKYLIRSAAILSTITFAGAALADDPLNYPPFKWYPLFPTKTADKTAAPSKAGQQGPQKDFSQGKQLNKQWYDGDFSGMDDD